MHRRSRNYICAAANSGKTFKHPGDLSSHAKSHGKPLKCTHCNYENTDKRSLKSHLGTHSRVATFKCKLCGKLFVHSNQLLHHRPKCPKNVKLEPKAKQHYLKQRKSSMCVYMDLGIYLLMLVTFAVVRLLVILTWSQIIS